MTSLVSHSTQGSLTSTAINVSLNPAETLSWSVRRLHYDIIPVSSCTQGSLTSTTIAEDKGAGSDWKLYLVQVRMPKGLDIRI